MLREKIKWTGKTLQLLRRHFVYFNEANIFYYCHAIAFYNTFQEITVTSRHLKQDVKKTVSILLLQLF